MFDLLHSSTNQEVFEKHLCSKSSHYEKYGRFLVTQRKPLREYTNFKIQHYSILLSLINICIIIIYSLLHVTMLFVTGKVGVGTQIIKFSTVLAEMDMSKECY